MRNLSHALGGRAWLRLNQQPERAFQDNEGAMRAQVPRAVPEPVDADQDGVPSMQEQAPTFLMMLHLCFCTHNLSTYNFSTSKSI